MYEKTTARVEVMKDAATAHPESILYPFDLLYGHDWFEAIYVLTQVMGGSQLYVPSARKIFAKCLEIEAKKDFISSNPAMRSNDLIAKKYGYSSQHMREILSR